MPDNSVERALSDAKENARSARNFGPLAHLLSKSVPGWPSRSPSHNASGPCEALLQQQVLSWNCLPPARAPRRRWSLRQQMESVVAKKTVKTKSAKSAVTATIGEGGETHQTAASSEQALTTNQGAPIADNQNSLKSGARGPTLLEDFVLREKITHFDHERIPERIVHARGSGAHGYFQPTKSLARLTKAAFLQDPATQDGSICAVLDRGWRRRLRRHAARRSRLRGEILHIRRQFRSRRQQHPGVLHSGRHQVSRPHPFREDGAGPRLSASGVRARHVLGLCFADARKHAYADLGHVRSGHPAIAAHDRGLRHPYVPAGQ